MSSKGRGWSESDFTQWMCKKLERVNAKTVAFVGSKMQGTGIPDRYICHRHLGGGLWAEMKKDDRRVSDPQRRFLNGVFERGDTALVIRYRADQTVKVEHFDGTELGWHDLQSVVIMDDVTAGHYIVNMLIDAKMRQEKLR